MYSHNLIMQMDFQVRMVHISDNHILFPGVREKKLQQGVSHLTFQKIKAVKIISQRDTYLVMFINQSFSNNAKNQ